jgi:hypothetical protein
MTTIETPAVNAPTPDRPYWHDETGGRLALGDALVRIDVEAPADTYARHVEAIAELAHAAVEARLGEGNGAARTLAMAAGGLCQEIAGLWPSQTASR